MSNKPDVYFDRVKREWCGIDSKGNIHRGKNPVIVRRAIEVANAMYAEGDNGS